MRKQSEYICYRCGSSLTWYGEQGWRHVNGGRSETRACKKPVPITREAFDREMSDLVGAARDHIDREKRP